MLVSPNQKNSRTVSDCVLAGQTRVSLRELHYQENGRPWLDLLFLAIGVLAVICQEPWWLALAWFRALSCPFQLL